MREGVCDDVWLRVWVMLRVMVTLGVRVCETVRVPLREPDWLGVPVRDAVREIVWVRD